MYDRSSMERGQGLAEFIIIAILVALVVLASVRLFGQSVSCEFRSAGNEIDANSALPPECRTAQTAEPEPEPNRPPPAPSSPPPPPPSPPPASPVIPPSPQPSAEPVLPSPTPLVAPPSPEPSAETTPEPQPSPGAAPSPEPAPSVAPSPSPEPSASPIPSPSPSASPSPSPEELVEFDNPTFGGSPLDLCLIYGAQCGQVAADSFCRGQGLSAAKSFTEGRPVTKSGIPNGAYCDFSLPPTQTVCRIFSKIVCKK